MRVVRAAVIVLASALELATAAYSQAPKYPTNNSTSVGATSGTASATGSFPGTSITATANATSTVPSATAACAIVSSLSAVQRAASPTATPVIDAAIAYECLNSVALNKTAALALVDATEPYIEWQSDLADLKSPPADYFYGPLDVLGKLAEVRANLEADFYANEYAFQADFFQVFAAAHDGHFILYPDLLTRAFDWGRQVAIVSVSSDGNEIPQIHAYDDVVASPSDAPVLVEINGIDAATYVADFAYTASFNQDADAAYNTMFYEKAFVAGGVGTGYFSINGRVRYIYPGANTTFTYDNGTTITYDNVARVKGSFFGVVDGPTFYRRFCLPSSGLQTSIAAPVETTEAPVGYPAPVVSTNDSIVSGYFLEGSEFEDVAVLSLLSMESESPVEFQAVVQDFLAAAVAAGKTKLVLDLQANGGGYILQGYDTFRQLFPQTKERDYTRFRENDAFLAIAEIYSAAAPDDFDPATATRDEIMFYESWFNWQYDYNLTDQPFPSFESKFAPQVHLGADYTSIIRWNFNDPLTTINDTYGFGTDITGYRSRTNFSQPFAAEDIIILHDGFCASTCIILSEFLKWDAGVKSVAMGGRPNKEKIQGMGGVKGAQSYAFSSIYGEAQAALELATPEQAVSLERLTPLPIQRSTASSVNLRDDITPDHLNDGIPAQVVAEYADCRLYWTAPMISDVTEVWKAVASAAWGGAACVAGSLSQGGNSTTAPVKKRSTWEMKDAENRRKSHVVPRDVLGAKDAIFTARHGRKVVQ
ncbi:hypothetical protein PVAG01_08792 [Phlyctema vagabunda]|uniref:CPAF-like PDZ domain-containing protein n=1 Tax=Phlyctema vagabunda TaxID=108571 RepID=A0ABR4PAJ0_9HELO